MELVEMSALAPSGLSGMSAYLSAFGAKRTCPDRRWCLDRVRMTQSGHEQAAFAAMHGRDLLYTPPGP